MNDTVIRAEGLGKRYLIGRQVERESYTALRDVLARTAKGFVRSAVGVVRGRQLVTGDEVEEFWALKDVSFEVKRGEVVGIIGRNGAGKSTLLKVLSRITEPSEGRVMISGRVASLLEVGTGFHPELTGRENIYLNGAILGMRRAEIKHRFDEIVAFAEVGQFLDTPVKRYSSGMYVRLAFAVAAYIEPEILVVDEVLAVGDAEFQKKCLGKMRDFSKSGRTVLFVSHNMAAVHALCASGILLDHGRLAFKGTSREAVDRYLEPALSVAAGFRSRALSKHISLIHLEATPKVVRCHGRMVFNVELEASESDLVSDLALLIHAPGGERAALIDLRSASGPYSLSPGARLVVRIEVPHVPFVEMDLGLGLYIDANSVCQSFLDLVTFAVVPDIAPAGLVPRQPQFRGLVELRAAVESAVVSARSPHREPRPVASECASS